MAKILLSELFKIMAIILTVVYFLFLRKKLCRDMIRGEICGWIIICIGYFVLKIYSQINLPSVGHFCRVSISTHWARISVNGWDYSRKEVYHAPFS